MTAASAPHLKYPSEGDSRPRVRDGRNPIERKAVYRVQSDISSFSASLVVRLALRPLVLADWARELGVTDSVVYNMFSKRRPYRRLRRLLADQLGVEPIWVDHLIDAACPIPSLRVPPDPWANHPVVAPIPSPAKSPGPRPWIRDGRNPIEIKARFRVETDIASFPASEVVQLIFWPQTLTQLARQMRIRWDQQIYDALSGCETEPEVREKLARSLGVDLVHVCHLIEAELAAPASLIPPDPPVAPVDTEDQRTAAEVESGNGDSSTTREMLAWTDSVGVSIGRHSSRKVSASRTDQLRLPL